MAVNRIRGESLLVIDAKPYCLCLTLGALAEIETELGLSDSSQLSERLSKISANDVLIILSALLSGGDNPIAIEKLRSCKIVPEAVTVAIAEAFGFSRNRL